MGYLNNNIFKKTTLFSGLCIVGILLGIPLGLYNLTLKGGQSLGGVLLLLGVLGLILLLILDRALVSVIKPLKLSIVEFFLAALIFVGCQLQEKKVFVNLEHYQENYFVIIYSNGTLKGDPLENNFLFDKAFQVHKKYLIISDSIASQYQVRVSSPSAWKSMEMRPMRLNGFKIEFYNSEKGNYDSQKIKQLVKTILAATKP